MKRSRGRNRRSGGNNQNSHNNPNRHYESVGPDVKIRGSAQQVLDKYQQYARDAQTSGDRILSAMTTMTTAMPMTTIRPSRKPKSNRATRTATRMTVPIRTLTHPAMRNPTRTTRQKIQTSPMMAMTRLTSPVRAVAASLTPSAKRPMMRQKLKPMEC